MTETIPETGGEIPAALAAALPFCPPELAQRLLLEVAAALGVSGDPADAADDAAKLAASLQAIAAADPRDALEAMLATQMAAVHGAAMRALRRAEESRGYPEIEALYARQAARLMQLFLRQSEALEKRRERRAEARRPVRPAADCAAEETAAPEARSIAARAGPRKAPRRTGRPSACPNGTAGPPRNGRRHDLNGTAPPL